MSIVSFAYLAFLGGVIAGLRALNGLNPAWRRLWLLAASYAFYGLLHWSFLVSLVGVTIVAYAGSIAIQRASTDTGRRLLVGLSVALLIGQLALFKVVPSLPATAIERLSELGLDLPPGIAQLVVPVGLSFYSFISIGYLVDVHRRTVPAQRGLGEVALLIGFFPHVLAGPIGRARQLLPQFSTVAAPTVSQFQAGLALLLRGLAKKLLIADLLGVLVVDPAFSSISTQPAGFLLVALYGYTLQIYFDLSGYTDLARGAAKLMGIELMENFRQPYRSTSVSQFWTRWHISMSSFFRDYLYFSLGGSKTGNVYANLMLTFLAIGMWHDIGWSFALYGLLHGSVVAAERFGRNHWGSLAGRIPPGVGLFATFHFVVFSRLLFRAPDIQTATSFVERLFGATTWPDPGPLGWLSVGVLGAAALLVAFGDRLHQRALRAASPVPNLSIAGAALTLTFMIMSFQANQDRFLYFAF